MWIFIYLLTTSVKRHYQVNSNSDQQFAFYFKHVHFSYCFKISVLFTNIKYVHIRTSFNFINSTMIKFVKIIISKLFYFIIFIFVRLNCPCLLILIVIQFYRNFCFNLYFLFIHVYNSILNFTIIFNENTNIIPFDRLFYHFASSKNDLNEGKNFYITNNVCTVHVPYGNTEWRNQWSCRWSRRGSWILYRIPYRTHCSFKLSKIKKINSNCQKECWTTQFVFIEIIITL